MEKDPPVIPIIMFSCDRTTISRSLDTLFQYRPSDRFPVFVSQDCHHAPTANVIATYGENVTHWVYPDGDRVETEAKARGRVDVAYHRIADHYRWALHQVFDVHGYNQVIMMEDDMEVSPDFFAYFSAMLPVLIYDPSLYCVSSWNDDGKAEYIGDSKAFYRSDFMPGLGWMMLRELWVEVGWKWPKTQWDEWLRAPAQRRGRACIIPEVSRNFNFGKKGASDGWGYDEFVGKTVANHDKVVYTEVDVFALEKSRYDPLFLKKVYEDAVVFPGGVPAFSIDILDALIRRLMDASTKNVKVRIEYADSNEFMAMTKVLHLFRYVSVDAPRASYLGIVTLKRHIELNAGILRDATVYIAPVMSFWHGNVFRMGRWKGVPDSVS